MCQRIVNFQCWKTCFPSANPKVSCHMWEKTYRTYVRSTKHKKLLMQQENKLFPTTKTTNSPSFLPGIIEWVKFMSVHENNLLWSREQMNGKKIKMRTGESCYLSWDLFLESPGNCLGRESCFAFAIFAFNIQVLIILKMI